MGGSRSRAAFAEGAVRRTALALVCALALVAAASAVGAAGAAEDTAPADADGATAGAVAAENASAGDPRVVDASVHEVDDGQRVLVVVLETDEGTDTVVTGIDVDGERSGDAASAGDARDLFGDGPSSDVDLPNSTADDPSSAADRPDLAGIDLANVSGGSISADELSIDGVGTDGVEGAHANGSTADAGAPGSGSVVDGPIHDVPDALRSPPERLTRAVSWDPAFGGGWLLPSAFAALGGTMSILGVGALAIWRRTI